MKRLFLVSLWLLAASAAFSKAIKVPATTNGLWCDLIRLRAEVKNETGNAMPYSAKEECEAMGFIKGDSSLVSHKGDSLSYDTETGVLLFDAKGFSIGCDVATNTVASAPQTSTYFVFPSGIGCCNCDGGFVDSSTTALPLVSASNETAEFYTPEEIETASFDSDTQLAALAAVDCPFFQTSLEGGLLPSDCFHIEEKIAHCKGADSIKGYWQRVLPIIELSFSDSSSKNYPEIARYLLCAPLDSFDIRLVVDMYVIAKKDPWQIENIRVPKQGYAVEYVDLSHSPQKVLAGFDLHVAEKAHAANGALKEAMLDTLPFERMMAKDTGTFPMKFSHKMEGTNAFLVTLELTSPFAKTATIYDQKKKIALFSVFFDAHLGTISVLNLQSGRESSALSVSKKKDRDEMKEIRKILGSL